MRLETFFEKFEQFAEAPNAVAKMRELILSLAVRGKLVSQDPSDEPVANDSGRNGELGAQAPFAIPEQWAWTQLSELADINGGFAFKSTAYSEEGTRVVRISDFDEFGFKDHNIVRHSLTPELQRFNLSEGSILMAMTGGTVGKSYYVRSLPEPMIVNQRVATIKVSSQANPSYIDILIKSDVTQEAIHAAKNSTNDNISMVDIKGFAIPFPPLAEQQRIVAKVDELMALCDRLEVQQQERDTKYATLSLASLARFAEAPTPANLNFLFNSSYAIAPAGIRKTILTLAVQGKLVSQDPNDEPAAALLPRIQKRRAELHKIYQLPKPSEPTRIDYDSEVLLPDSWIFVRIGELCLSIVPQRDKPLSFSGNIPWVTLPSFSENAINLNQGYDQTGLSLDEVARYRLRIVPAGSVLMSCIGRFGLVSLLDQDVVPNQQLHGFCFPQELLDGRYLCYTIMAQKDYLASQATTTTIAYLNKTKCESVPVALPPLAEQRRIVAKVDQLMALVDQLEMQLATSRVASNNLMEAVVSELTTQE